MQFKTYLVHTPLFLSRASGMEVNLFYMLQTPCYSRCQPPGKASKGHRSFSCFLPSALIFLAVSLWLRHNHRGGGMTLLCRSFLSGLLLGTILHIQLCFKQLTQWDTWVPNKCGTCLRSICVCVHVCLRIHTKAHHKGLNPTLEANPTVYKTEENHMRI